MGEAIGYIKLNIKDYMQKYREVHEKSELLDKTANGLGTVFDKAGKMMAAAFASVTAAATLALKSVVNVGSSFQASMSQVAATMGMSADEIANNSEEYTKLSQAAKDMGATTKFSATEAANALNYLALAGYSVDESISVLPKILSTAAAGGMDLARASDMVTDAMSALGLPLEEAGIFVDRLARTAQKSNTSVAQLGDAILQIGGTAKSLAGGVTELNTALGILANNGIKAAEGGTALRQIILNLTAPSDKAAKFMEEIGFSAYDAAGNMKPLNQTFAELNDILSKYNTQQEKDTVLTTIFDARQLKSARALLANYGQEWDELYEEIENANGAASRMADTMQENLTGAITIAKSALEGVQVTAFEALEKGLTRSVKQATSSIDELNQTLQTPEMQEALAKISVLLGNILTKFADFVANSAIPKAIEWFSNLDKVMNVLKGTLAGVAAALPLIATGFLLSSVQADTYIAKAIAAKVATLALNASMLANPFTAVALALGVLVGAVVKYVSETKSIIESAKNQETEFSKAAEAARENAKALEEYRQKSDEIAGSVTSQVNELRNATNALGEYANKTNLTADELATAQTIIDKLNELYPENTAYIQDGQVVAYNELAQSIQDYTDKLYYAKQLEANQEKYFASRELVDQTTEALDGQAEAFLESQKSYQYWLDQYESFVKNEDILDEQLKEQLKDSGIYSLEGYMPANIKRVRNYLLEQKSLAEANRDNALQALDTNREVLAQAQKDLEESERDMITLRLKAGEEVEGIYADEAAAKIAIGQAYADEQTRINQEAHKDEIEANRKAAEDKEKAYNKMWEDLADLDKNWQLRRINSEEEYQKRRKELLEQNPNEQDDKWVKEYNKSLVYQEKILQDAENEKTRIEKEAADERQQAREEEIANQWQELENRNEIDRSFTKEMVIQEKEIIVNGLDKTSAEYKKFNKQLIEDKKQLKIELAKENQQLAENDFKTWQNSYDKLVSEATGAYDQIKTNQDNLMKSLTGNIKLYDTESKKVWDKQSRAYKTEEDIKVNSKAMAEQVAETEKYIAALDKLQGKIPDSLMAEILAMDKEEGEKYVAELSKMSAAELKSYSESYQKIYEASEEFSKKIYENQLQTFKQEYTDKFENLFKEVPKNMNLVGQNSIDGFIQGVESKNESATGELADLMKNVIAKTKEILDIHSPSGKFEEIGENTVLGIPKGVKNKEQEVFSVFRALGKNSGDSFISGFKAVWGGFVEGLKNDINSLSMLTAMANVEKPNPITFVNSGVNQSSALQYPQLVTYQNNTYREKAIGKEDIVQAIKEAMPDGDIVLQVDGRRFGLISRKQLNLLASESGNLNLQN